MALLGLFLSLFAAEANAYQERFQVFVQNYKDTTGNIERSTFARFLTNFGPYNNTLQLDYFFFNSTYVAPNLLFDLVPSQSERHSFGISSTMYLARYSSINWSYTRLAGDFFDSDNLSLGFSQGFFQNNTNINVTAAYVNKDYLLGNGIESDASERVIDGLPTTFAYGQATGISTSLTQVVSPTSTFRVAGTYSDEDYYPSQWDGLVDFRQALSPVNSAHVFYRYYSNAADIRSHTIRGRFYQTLMPGILLMVQGRYYFEEEYTDQALEYLEDIRDALGLQSDQGTANYQFGARFRFNLVELFPQAEGLTQLFEEFNLQFQYDWMHIRKDFLESDFSTDASYNEPADAQIFLFGIDLFFRN